MCFPVKFAKFFYRTPPVASSEHYVLNYDYSENVTDSLIPVGSCNIIQARRNEKNSGGGRATNYEKKLHFKSSKTAKRT